MLVPLGVLAFGALFAGLAFKDAFIDHGYAEFWKGSLFTAPDNHIMEEFHHVPALVAWSPTVMLFIGFALALWFYILDTRKPAQLASEHPIIYDFLLNKWYFDELYDRLVVRPARVSGDFGKRVIETEFVQDTNTASGFTSLMNATSSCSGRSVK